jgi:hypothetical protein
MLASVRFREQGSEATPAPADQAASPIDGVWTTSITRDELANSPLLYDSDEVNDENWGEFTFASEQGRFTLTQENPKAMSSISGTFAVDGDAVELNLDVEHFEMRWSLNGEELSFERDESLGIAPTPFILKPWTKQP